MCKNVIVIYGPTAVGKSSIAISLAKKINGEIISADSMQIYKNLDIGTAKISNDEMYGIVHHLLNIKLPQEDYSVYDWCVDAKKCIEVILQNGHTPIIVGGTGLYIKALIDGYNFANTEKNIEFREKINSLSNEELFNSIKAIDHSYVIDGCNRQRLIRALEKLKYGTETTNSKSNYDFKLFVIVDEREKIYTRINERVDKMAKNGLIEEAKYLQLLHLPESNQAIKAIGYKELFPYLNNEKSLKECLDILKQKSRNYAKRQLTYLNQFKDYNKINFCGIDETANIIYNLLKDKE